MNVKELNAVFMWI